MLINGFFTAAAGGSADAVPLCWWQGWSGYWYVTSTMPLRRRSCDAPGLFVLAHRDAIGNCTPVVIGTSPDIEHTLSGPAVTTLEAAVRAGANELHVNLVGSTPADWDRAAFDIARAWNVPVWQ